MAAETTETSRTEVLVLFVVESQTRLLSLSLRDLLHFTSDVLAFVEQFIVCHGVVVLPGLTELRGIQVPDNTCTFGDVIYVVHLSFKDVEVGDSHLCKGLQQAERVESEMASIASERQKC